MFEKCTRKSTFLIDLKVKTIHVDYKCFTINVCSVRNLDIIEFSDDFRF